MSSHMSRKYARNYRKRKSEESSRQKESKKPKKSRAEQMRELRQRRKENENEKTTQSDYIAGPSGIQRPATVQTSTDHGRTSLEGNAKNSDNIEIDANVTAPDEYVLRSPICFHGKFTALTRTAPFSIFLPKPKEIN